MGWIMKVANMLQNATQKKIAYTQLKCWRFLLNWKDGTRVVYFLPTSFTKKEVCKAIQIKERANGFSQARTLNFSFFMAIFSMLHAEALFLCKPRHFKHKGNFSLPSILKQIAPIQWPQPTALTNSWITHIRLHTRACNTQAYT